MNDEIKAAMVRQVSTMTQLLEDLPRDLMAREIADMEKAFEDLREKNAAVGVLELYDDMLRRMRLALQWSNQANEQLLCRKDRDERLKTVTPELVSMMVRGRGGPFGL